MQEIKREIILKALEDKLISDIKVIDVSENTPFFTYYILGTMKNSRQGRAAVDKIEEEFEKSNLRIKTVDGRNSEDWICVDCYEILVHLFLEEKRNQISLEDLLNETKKQS